MHKKLKATRKALPIHLLEEVIGEDIIKERLEHIREWQASRNFPCWDCRELFIALLDGNK